MLNKMVQFIIYIINVLFDIIEDVIKNSEDAGS